MKAYALKLIFTSPLRATRPAAESLGERHVEAIRGRFLELARKELGARDEEELAELVRKWKMGNLSVFARKQFNGVTQICIPSAWIYGFLESQIRARQLRKITSEAIQQFYQVRPRLIGLVKRDRAPVTPEDVALEEATIISRDSAKKRSAIRYFETVYPPVATEMIIIRSFSPMHQDDELELLRTLFSFGRMGATRGQGCGEFKLRWIHIFDPDKQRQQ